MHSVKNCLKLQQNYCFLNLQAPKNKKKALCSIKAVKYKTECSQLTYY